MKWSDAFATSVAVISVVVLIGVLLTQAIGCEKERQKLNAEQRKMMIEAAKSGALITDDLGR